MSKYEGLRQAIRGMKQEATDKEAGQRSFQLEQEQKRLAEEQRHREYLRICERNWPFAKAQILQVFQEINRLVLQPEGLSGNIIPWRKIRTKHNHIGSTPYSGKGGMGSFTYRFKYEAECEVAELKVGNIGKLVAFRELKTKRTVEGKKPEINSEPSGLVYINVCGPNEVTCSECLYFDSFSEHSIHIDEEPEEIAARAEKLSSEKVQSLVARQFQK